MKRFLWRIRGKLHILISQMTELKIFIHRLKDDRTEKISGTLPSDLMGIHETDLAFDHPISLEGDAYLASGHLIIHLKIATSVRMPCTVCNEMVTLPISISNFYHSVDVSSLPEAVFDYTDTLREGILIEVPKYVECNNNACPERQSIQSFLKEDRTYYPFSKLEE